MKSLSVEGLNRSYILFLEKFIPPYLHQSVPELAHLLKLRTPQEVQAYFDELLPTQKPDESVTFKPKNMLKRPYSIQEEHRTDQHHTHPVIRQDHLDFHSPHSSLNSSVQSLAPHTSISTSRNSWSTKGTNVGMIVGMNGLNGMTSATSIQVEARRQTVKEVVGRLNRVFQDNRCKVETLIRSPTELSRMK